ncbi:hypothetical protein GCK72_017433 [Caenorhabditis remanei]|uniref:THAP-type domain-containing protein n=1 Tax=Caenorhabditis remanei TaxID=31234 RepID=A0A6A5G893_CAERE|nr:hypothetical protein GCK72_017433 [Caenorhabditis remanei]KAF1750882.1 hypothetical protein GCK72_017433 [Caenorhabditis remanei]
MADPEIVEPSESLPKTSIRRRSCVVCRKPTPNHYVTSFTRAPEKQEQWTCRLANGDEEFATDLREKLAAGRKYLCLDHFDRKDLVHRKMDGMEVIRNRLPIPYRNTYFVRHSLTDTPSTSEDTDMSPIPEKRRKMSTPTLAGKGAELDPASMTLLMDTVNLYVKRAMEEADV